MPAQPGRRALLSSAVTVTADAPVEDTAVRAAVREAGYEVTAA